VNDFDQNLTTLTVCQWALLSGKFSLICEVGVASIEQDIAIFALSRIWFVYSYFIAHSCKY